MISEETLVKEFIRVVNHYYPRVGELLDDCYVKVITCYWGRPSKRLQYIGIYCSNEQMPYVQVQKMSSEKLQTIWVSFRWSF